MKTVKVKDLIEKLKKFDPNLPVFISGYELGIEDLKLTNVKRQKVKIDANVPWHIKESMNGKELMDWKSTESQQ